MLKVLICHSDSEVIQSVSTNIKAIFLKLNINYKLAKYLITDNEDKRIINELKKFDIFFIQSDIEIAKNILEEILLTKPNTSIICISKNINQIEPLLMYRPVGNINEFFDEKEVARELKNAYKNLTRYISYLKIKTKNEILKISTLEIDYIENNGRIVTVHNFEKKEFVEFYAKFEDVYKELHPNIFFKCHQSFIVNMNYVYKFDKINNQFVLKSGKIIDVSRRYSKSAAEFFEEYLQ